MSGVSYYYLTSPEPGPAVAATPEQELLRVAIAVNKGHSAEQVLDTLFDTLDGLIPYDRIGLALLRPPDVLTLRHVRARGRITWGVGAEAAITGTSLEPIVRESKVRIIDDLAAYAREHPRSRTAPLLLAEGMRASLTLPVASEGLPVGVLFFTSTRPHAYGPRHVDFVRALAAGVGLALARARLIEDLRRANAELAALDRLKTDFLSNLSHELRTPLTHVTGYAELLEESADALTPVQRDYLAHVAAGAGTLRRLLDDLFDFTALETGVLALDRAEVDLAALVGERVRERRDEFGRAGLRLALHAPDGPLWVHGDRPKLARIVRSLLDNAGRFTPPPGEVDVTVGQDERTVYLRVRDTGIGIAPAHQARVFDKFYQIDGGSTRAHGGTGLGLALAKAIAEAHGGAITVQSEPGRGATFEVRLPRADQGA